MLGSEVSPSEGVQIQGKLSTSSEDSTASMMDFKKCIAFIGAMYFFFMTSFVIPIACVASCFLFLGPLMFINMKLYNKLEHKLCSMVNEHWVATSYYCGLQVREYGAKIDDLEDKQCLLMANHLGLIDHFVLMTSLHDRGRVSGSWMWVIYNIWKYTPLGAMWTAHGNFFVNGGPTRRAALLKTFKNHLTKHFHKHNYGWIVMYPEGSRFYLVKQSGAKFATKNGLAQLQHCVYPRSAAAHAVLEVLAPKKDDPQVANIGSGAPINYIIDATLGYPKGDVVSVGDAMMGDFPHNDPVVAVHYDVIPVDPEWTDESKLQKFLYERYQIKNELLDYFYKTGHFPGERCKDVEVSIQRMLLAQAFWIFAYYVHHELWIKPIWLLLAAYVNSFF